ncbi:MAG: fibro-slime domain-containing protein [Lachnospiraceae bacterium]|nr:fibro-slime domain-containing protein [Lachnospiraceae bacterium]
MNLRSSLAKKNPKKVVGLVLSLCLLAGSIGGMTISLADADEDSSETQIAETYCVPNVVNPDTGQNMYVIRSTFYDYYSDSQITAEANPGKIKDAITSGKNTFTKFNKRLLEDKKYGSESESPAMWPLYEGLFFSKQESNQNGDMYYYDDANAVKNYDTNFWLAANHTQTSGTAAATQGLVDPTLDNNGNITQSNSSNGKTCVLPYFDKTYLTSTKHAGSGLTLGSVKENVGFPLVTSEQNGTVYYSFDSSQDTVIFNANDQLNYQGKNNKQVKDSNGDAGFFPYNGTGDSQSYGLNYGFGVKMDIPFSMTADGKVNGQDMVFEFAGDDDLWVFVDGELVLDVGGIHGKVSGKINFATLSSTVSGVKNNTIAFSNPNCLVVEDKKYSVEDLKALGLDKSGEEHGILKDVAYNFSDNLKQKLRDTSKSHTMTVFYMERGKVGSNLKIGFNMPEPNKLELSNTIDYTGVNNAFMTATGTAAINDTFLYDVVDKDSNLMDEANVKGGESVVYQDRFKKDETLMVEQVKLKDSGRKIKKLYQTAWTLSDATGDIASSASRSAEIVSDGRVQETDAFLFKNKTDEGAAPNLKVKFINKVNTGNLVIRNEGGEGVSTGKSFKYTVKIANIFGGDSKESKFTGTYKLIKASKKKYSKKCTTGVISLKAGEEAIIEGVPVDTKFSVSQENASGCELEKVGRLDGTDYTNENNIATGQIIAGVANQNAYVFYNKSTGGGSVQEIDPPVVEDIIEEPAMVEPVEPYDGIVKDEVTPKTSDEKNSFTPFWVISIIVSVILVGYAAYILFKDETKKKPATPNNSYRNPPRRRY